ncbi:MAG: pentapeptide repeat-containing protein [Nostocaceae cyanobacterium]|nr:pentapeptide repeat-containing protein [Nostocaceae cyanobacterium]
MKIKWLAQLKTINLTVFVLGCASASVIGVICISKWQVPDLKLNWNDRDWIEFEKTVPGILIQALSGTATFTAALVTWRGINATFKNTLEAQITERFSRAIDQLGSDKLEIRLGGIYALERISKDSDKDYWQIIEILTAYVREKAPARTFEENKKDILSLPTDIQAVLTVITRRTRAYGQGEKHYLDLSKSDLQKANLQKARLRYVNLRYASLWKADLQNAYLWKADLQNAYLQNAYLQNADLQNADLQGAKNLTPEQVKTAMNWEKAKYDPEFRAILGLQPEEPETLK